MNDEQKILLDYLTKFFEHHSNVPYMFNNGYWTRDKVGKKQEAYYTRVDIKAPLDSVYEAKRNEFLSITLAGYEEIQKKFRARRTKNAELLEEAKFLFDEFEKKDETPFPPPSHILEIMERDHVSIVLQAVQCQMMVDENAKIVQDESEEVGRKLVFGYDSA